MTAGPVTTCRWIAGTVLALGLVAGAPGRASAELVRLSTGPIMSVAAYRTDGDTAVLTLRDGGEMRLPKSTIAEVLEDEVFHPKPGARVISTIITLPVQTGWTRDQVFAKVDAIADLVGVDRRLAHAVVRTESNYEPGAISSKGAMGLMQIMPDVARDFAVVNPFDPDANLTAGLRYLRDLVTRLGIRNGLAAYNAGEGSVTRYGGIPPYRETQDYVQRILALLRQ
jgi:hypothetical protein